jgi:hypothetical protein
MPTLADILLGASLTTLTVRIPGSSEDQSHIVQHGMTIGRDPDNAIVVDHCDVCAVHAAIYHPDGSDVLRIECVQSGFRLRNDDGKDVDGWPLNDGLVFWIGAVQFTCGTIAIGVNEPREMMVSVATREEPKFALPVLPAIRASCPRCHESVSELPLAAKFCPRCGLELPEHCPPWTSDGELNLSNPALAAYAHALFNLGARYELTNHRADLEQAIRYYEKAAKIGVPAARARLDARELS